MRLRNEVAVDAKESVDLVQMALAEMWPLKDKERVVEGQIDIAMNPLVPPVVRAMATKNLVTMGVCNLKVIDTVRQLQGSEKPPMRLTDDERKRAVAGLLEYAPQSDAPTTDGENGQILEFA